MKKTILLIFCCLCVSGICRSQTVRDDFNDDAIDTSLTSIATPLDFLFIGVGDSGNPPDSLVMSDGTTGYGSVNYPYEIGKYEVTCSGYAAFLNAKAKSDPFNLFNPLVIEQSGVTRSGAEGNYSYSVRDGFANKPIVQVSFYSALRFCNWLNNGATELSDTETGAYTLEGKTTVPSNGITVTRNPGAKVFLPSENEWYKAAFYQPTTAGGPVGGYWLYATRSDTAPTPEPPPGGINSANYDRATGTVTDVGAYVNSPSFYGTFDQDGNVDEWTEAIIGNTRVIRQGGWADPGSLSKQASFRRSLENNDATHGNVGFRVARTPPPTCDEVVAAGLDRITQTLQAVRPKKPFEIPGNAPLDQFESLVKAIEDLNHGQKVALRANLEGQR